MKAAAHHVNFNKESDTLIFTCLGDEESECRNYPDCECEIWGKEHEHPFVRQEKCWMERFWFNESGIACYTGDDETDCVQHAYDPATSGAGLVRTWFEDEQLVWEWEDPEVTF